MAAGHGGQVLISSTTAPLLDTDAVRLMSSARTDSRTSPPLSTCTSSRWRACPPRSRRYGRSATRTSLFLRRPSSAASMRSTTSSGGSARRHAAADTHRPGRNRQDAARPPGGRRGRGPLPGRAHVGATRDGERLVARARAGCARARPSGRAARRLSGAAPRGARRRADALDPRQRRAGDRWSTGGRDGPDRDRRGQPSR